MDEVVKLMVERARRTDCEIVLRALPNGEMLLDAVTFWGDADTIPLGKGMTTEELKADTFKLTWRD